MKTCPDCFRPLNEGNSPNLEECHDNGDPNSDVTCCQAFRAGIEFALKHLEYSRSEFREIIGE